MRICTTCKEDKHFTEFSPDYIKPDGHLRIITMCLGCNRIKDKKRSPKSRRKEQLKRIYGVTDSTVKRLIKDQNSKCGGCGRTSKKLMVDHNHETQEIRGMLCGNCNTAAGLMNDNPEYLRNLAKYLESPPAKLTLADYIEGMA